MYLLNTPITIEWELLATATPPALSALDLIIIDPLGNQTYLDAPIDAGDYTAPTALLNGTVNYIITPQYEGFWRIRLVTGTSDDYTILSKVEMQVFDSTITTAPYSSQTGEPTPYDINYYLQGYIVSGEVYGSFVASRSVSIDGSHSDHKAVAEESPEFDETVLLILHNGTQIGTITFPVASLTGTIVMNSQLVAIGDRLQIKVGPGTADARIRDISINLVGCCTVVPCTVF